MNKLGKQSIPPLTENSYVLSGLRADARMTVRHAHYKYLN